MRESLYQGVGTIATQAAGFFAAGPESRSLWAPALTGGLDAMPAQHVRLLIRHIITPLCRHCPPQHRAAWLVPVLDELLPHMLERLGAGWRALDAAGGAGLELGSGSGLANGAHAAAAEDEDVAERLLRELTQEHMNLFKMLLQPVAGGSQVRSLAGSVQLAAQGICACLRRLQQSAFLRFLRSGAPAPWKGYV